MGGDGTPQFRFVPVFGAFVAADPVAPSDGGVLCTTTGSGKTFACIANSMLQRDSDIRKCERHDMFSVGTLIAYPDHLHDAPTHWKDQIALHAPTATVCVMRPLAPVLAAGWLPPVLEAPDMGLYVDFAVVSTNMLAAIAATCATFGYRFNRICVDEAHKAPGNLRMPPADKVWAVTATPNNSVCENARLMDKNIRPIFKVLGFPWTDINARAFNEIEELGDLHSLFIRDSSLDGRKSVVKTTTQLAVSDADKRALETIKASGYMAELVQRTQHEGWANPQRTAVNIVCFALAKGDLFHLGRKGRNEREAPFPLFSELEGAPGPVLPPPVAEVSALIL